MQIFAGRRRTRAARAIEAHRWLSRLDHELDRCDPGTNHSAAQAIADAAERRRATRELLSSSTSPHDRAQATQLALEGLHLLRAARQARGLEPGPAVPATAPALTGIATIEVGGVSYSATPCPSGATPYFYPGGTVEGRLVPAAWYSEPWWTNAPCPS